MRRINLWPSATDIEGISTHQGDVLSQALSGPIAILTGGPGVGKTYTAGAVLKAVIQQHGASSLAVCAPTGKAAVRITAAMRGVGLKHEATTIHRLLGVQRNGHDGGGWGFRYGAGNPLPFRFIAIDEVSMLETDLAANLLAAIQPGTHVLLIGDPGQLPPVGHGAPLRDLIAAGIPCGELVEVRRNAGDIVIACRDIRAGQVFTPSYLIDIPRGHNLKHQESQRPTWTMSHLERLIRTMPTGVSPMWDMQVLTSVRENSPLSRDELNKRLQPLLNPSPPIKQAKFRLNDKVICTSNQMLPTVDSRPGCEISEFVANGEIGSVAHCEPGITVVKFDAPDRTMVIRGQYQNDFDLAYALTVHKSQGSQWPIVIYVSDDYRGARFVASRELIYTAISRAEKLALTIGRKATIDLDCRREALSTRKTFLKELLTAA
jgi:exodeoxyribonuclease V alpha subunit